MNKLAVTLTILWLAGLQAFAQSVPEPEDQLLRQRGIAQAVTGSSSSHSSTNRQSVTVTSDGKRTIKRTVTVVNGVEKVVIETTDENGKITVTTEGGNTDEPPGKVWLGVRTKEVGETLRGQLGLEANEGIAVDVVAPGGPSEKAGIVTGDLILSFAGKPVSEPGALSKLIQQCSPGDSVKVQVMRKGRRQALDVTVTQRPVPNRENLPPSEIPEILGKTPPTTRHAFDQLLDDPNLPESFKEIVRRMREDFRAPKGHDSD